MLPGAALVDKIPLASCAAGDSFAGFSIVTDQRGFPRPDEPGGNCDIGAVEAPLALTPVTVRANVHWLTRARGSSGPE